MLTKDYTTSTAIQPIFMFKPGDQVKILPTGELAIVKYAGPTLLELNGDRWFFLRDGESLNPTAHLRIEALNCDHAITD